MNRKNSSSLDQVQTVQILLPGDLPLLLRHLSDPGCESNSHKAAAIQLDGSSDGDPDHLVSTYWDISGSLHSNGICKRGPKLLLLVATSKSDPQSLLLSIHRPTHYAVSGTSPLLQETFIIHLFYHTCFLHSADSVFILVVLGFWHNGSKLAVLLAC